MHLSQKCTRLNVVISAFSSMPIQNYLRVVLVELFWTRFVQAFSKCRWHGAELVVWDQLIELRTSLLICAPTQTGESFWWGCKCHHNLRWLVKFFQSCSSYRWQRCREGVKNLQSLKLVVHHILAPSQSTLNPLVHKLISCCGHDIVTIDIHNSFMLLSELSCKIIISGRTYTICKICRMQIGYSMSKPGSVVPLAIF